jgi:hypothetical protein
MRTKHSILLSGILALGLLGGAASCGKFNEGVNAQNLHVSVLVPKTVVTSASGIGVIYVGVYSGTDNHLGYVSPAAAPGPDVSLQNTFPFGGASLGDFETRDFRLRCKTVSNQSVADAGTDWKVEGDVLQFPFYKGEVVWAFADRYTAPVNLLQGSAYSTCSADSNGDGYYSAVGIPIDLEPVVQGTNGNWIMKFAPTPLKLGSDPVFPTNHNLDILDAKGHYWNAVLDFGIGNPPPIVNNHLDYGDTGTGRHPSLIVLPANGVNITPAITGNTQPRLEDNDNLDVYGTQFHDILNYPGKYVGSGDLITSTPAVLNTLDPVTITLDTTVP